MNPAELFERHEIRSLSLARDTDIRDTEACLVELDFADGHRVSFKILEGPAARTHQFLKAIGPAPECTLALTASGNELGPHEAQQLVEKFIGVIAGRVAKIHREQSILNIQPVGKTFLLHGKTRLEVLADDGRGQLTIRILRKEGGDEAGMAASDLLDGLHAGIITPA